MARSDLLPMKPQVYLDPRPAGYFTRFHERARTREPDWLYTFIKVVSFPYCRLVFRLRAQQVELVPPDGPVILAPNHFSSMNHWFVGIMLPRKVRFMAKSQLFKGRFLEFVLAHSGAFPVRRGQHDEEAITTAATNLGRAGAGLVIVGDLLGGRLRRVAAEVLRRCLQQLLGDRVLGLVGVALGVRVDVDRGELVDVDGAHAAQSTKPRCRPTLSRGPAMSITARVLTSALRLPRISRVSVGAEPYTSRSTRIVGSRNGQRRGVVAVRRAAAQPSASH